MTRATADPPQRGTKDPTTGGAPPPGDLASLLARIVRAPSPFYRERLARAGLAEAGLTAGDPAAAALARLPLTRRAELVRDQLDHLPFGTRRFADAAPPVRAGITGTGDDLLVLAWSATDLAQERAAGVRLLGRLGVTAGMRVANTLPGALATPGALLLGDVVEELGALDVPLGPIETEAAARAVWELMDRVEPDVLVLDAPSAPALLAAAPAGARPWWRGIVLLRCGDDARVRAVVVPAAVGFTGWQRTWLAVPEATSFVAHSCAAGRLHADEGVVVEVIETMTGSPVRAGVAGVLVVTLLAQDTQLLRYVSGLAAHQLAAPCPCGEPGYAFDTA